MSDEQAFEQAIHEIQQTLNQAERQLSRLGSDLRFLVGAGDLEIVRRDVRGGTLRPKVVVAELKGCDPMLWGPEHPAWMHALAPGHGTRQVPAAGGNGQPASPDEERSDGPEPPSDVTEEN